MELRNDMAELDSLKDRVSRFCDDIGLSRKECFQIKMSVEEIFVNIVSYGYQDDKEHWIKVSFAHEDEMVVLCFEDDGIQFNPLEACCPDLECPIEDREEGGLGLHLTKNLMSEIGYNRYKNRNCLTLKKCIAGQ